MHVSYRLRMTISDSGGEPTESWGCPLLPLPESISLACYLLMVPDDAVAGHRSDKDLDEITKDAVMEVGNFMGGAVDGCLRSLFGGRVIARFGGCQGVRADVRPAMPYEEGSPLIQATGSCKIADFPRFEFLMMMPPVLVGQQ